MKKLILIAFFLLSGLFVQAQVVTVITIWNGFNAQRASVDDFMIYRTEQSRSEAAMTALKRFISSSDNMYYSSISISAETIVLCTYSDRAIPVPITTDHILYKFYLSHRFLRPGDSDYEHYKSAALSRQVYQH